MYVLREDMAAPTIIDARPLLRVCDQAQSLMDEVASWLSGDESYDSATLSCNLAGAAMDLRNAMREAAE